MDKTRITNANKQHARRSAGAGEIKEISMSDLIDRQSAIEAVMECYDNDELFEVYEEKLRELPPAQPERIKGRWISADAIFGGEPFYCSECGENTRDTVMGKPRWNFCPNCGADMRGEQDE